eukprot:1573770-Alexandrium_andersonii.AAC.1
MVHGSWFMDRTQLAICLTALPTSKKSAHAAAARQHRLEDSAAAPRPPLDGPRAGHRADPGRSPGGPGGPL